MYIRPRSTPGFCCLWTSPHTTTWYRRDGIESAKAAPDVTRPVLSVGGGTALTATGVLLSVSARCATAGVRGEAVTGCGMPAPCSRRGGGLAAGQVLMQGPWQGQRLLRACRGARAAGLEQLRDRTPTVRLLLVLMQVENDDGFLLSPEAEDSARSTKVSGRRLRDCRR